jgi:hypothetical protein
MDALMFLKEKRRMCLSYPVSCEICPLFDKNNICDCNERIEEFPDKAIEIVEEWCKKHPRQTNGDYILNESKEGINNVAEFASYGFIKVEFDSAWWNEERK